jgi:hypothetical protein
VRTLAKSSLYLSVGLVAVGFLLIFLAWNGAAEKDFIQGQFPYLLSGGLTGMGLILCGLALAATQAHRRDMLSLQDRIDELIAAVQSSTPSTPAQLTAVPSDAEVFVTNGRTYHRPSCRTVQGRAGLDLVTADDVEHRELSACRICRPAA